MIREPNHTILAVEALVAFGIAFTIISIWLQMAVR